VLRDREDVLALTRTRLDVTDEAAVEEVLARERPATVYNCAAFHNLTECENDETRSFDVNARAVMRMARLCSAHGAKLVHMSTNYVFDGTRSPPYAEDDRPNPQSVYAISKLAGEYGALSYQPDTLVVRTGGLYGLDGSASKGGNFVTRMLDRAREQGALKMVADQRLSPTFTLDLAQAIVQAVDARMTGIVHLTNAGDCSWHEFTVEIMRLAGVDVPVEPGETTLGPGGVRRPLNGVLARPAADAAGIPELRDWSEALADYMRQAGLIEAAANAQL
jgi:dTDP-4-dehydrorhamnose reductase